MNTSAFDRRVEFFVAREAMSLTYDMHAEVCAFELKCDGVYVTYRGGDAADPDAVQERLVLRRNTYNFLQSSFHSFKPPLWRVSFSKIHQSCIAADIFINVAELEALVRRGERFPGRKLLFHAVVTCGITNYVEHAVTYRTSHNSSWRQNLTLAFASTIPNWTAEDAAEDAPMPPVPVRTRLYDFQMAALRQMLLQEREGATINRVLCSYFRIATDDHEVWMSNKDAMFNSGGCEHKDITFKGGFLTQKMGMGKTLTMLSLCAANPIQPGSIPAPAGSGPELRRPATTLVVCPSQIIHQWQHEIRTHTNLRSVALCVRKDIEELTIGRVERENYDFILVSFNVFCHPLIKCSLEYYSSNIPSRVEALRTEFQRQPPEAREREYFMPHVFDWGRVIVDEFHEVGQARFPGLGAYLSALRAEATWFVSGTPLVDPSLFRGMIPSVLFKGGGHGINASESMVDLIQRCNVCSAEYNVDIPPIEEKVVKVKLSKSERLIYDGLRTEGRDQQLRACSYVRLTKVMQGHPVPTLDEMKAVVQEHLRDKLSDLDAQLATEENRARVHTQYERLNLVSNERDVMATEATAVQARIAELTRVRSSVASTIKYVENEQARECVICYEEMQTTCMIKHCGHQMCQDCATKALGASRAGPGPAARCPVCRVQYSSKDMIYCCAEAPEDTLVAKYGSKFFHLLRYLSEGARKKTLIFSQWDDLLRDVGQLLQLELQGSRVLFCRGNVLQKQASIRKFQADNAYDVMLLSTLNSGSGTDLSVAKRVILLDCIDGEGNFISGTEQQAISRCCRIGQTARVEVLRFIATDTIEEDLYLQGGPHNE